MTVVDFENPEGSSHVRWRSNGRTIEKLYSRTVVAVRLASGAGVLAVEPQNYPNNAIIFNEDGSERVRLTNPHPGVDETSFTDAYYIGDELTVMLGSRYGQTACVFDEDGLLIREYESR